MANMTSNMEPREQRKPGGNGGQAESGGSETQGRAGSETQGRGGSETQGQGTAAKAANLAASAATRQIEKTRERIEDRMTQQREQITGSVRALGRALRGAGEVLDEDELAAHALHYASEKIERVAGYVAELSPDRVADDLRGVARSRPWWFYGGAFALGLALGRFARSSNEGKVMPGPRTPGLSESRESRALPRRSERSGEQRP